MLYLQQERYPEAIANLEKRLQIEPDHETSLDVLIPLLVQAGRSRDAEALLQAAWQKTKDSGVAVRFARFLISQEKLNEAYQFLLEALQGNDNAGLSMELALVLVVQEKYAEAVQALIQAVALRPDYDRAYRGLAHCYTQMEQPEKAIEFAERALAIDPRHYRNWQAKGDALLLLKRFADTVQAANMGIQLVNESSPAEQQEAQPVLGVLFLQRFNAQRRSGNIDGALAGLAEARARFPKDERFYVFPVRLLVQAGQPLKALEILHAALQAELAVNGLEEILKSLVASAVELYKSGDTPSARRIFEDLAESLPGLNQATIATAYILTGEGEYDRAVELLRSALENAGVEERGVCLCDLGYIQLLRSEYRQAEETFQAALQAPDSEAILRIAFWYQREMIPDFEPHPTRSVSTHWAATANLVALALAQQNLAAAQEIASQLHQHHQQSCTSHAILGCVALQEGNAKAARQAWVSAMGCAEDLDEFDLLKRWLDALPSPE
jgi:tetratricopeptide (TPR) repeat protein